MFEDQWWHYKILFYKFKDPINLIAKIVLFLVSLSSVFLLVVHLGYTLTHAEEREVVHTAALFLFVFFIASSIRYVLNYKEVLMEKLLVVDLFLYILLVLVLCAMAFLPNDMKHHFSFLKFLTSKWLLFSLLASLSIINISKFVFGMLSNKINPPLLFIYSFLLIILVGTGLLMLPKSTVHNIHFVDALFTSTTSVCVTGLCTIDVPTTFTFSGQLIILCLIQIGGIGVMTFTSFFALSFSGTSSFGGALLLRDFLNEKNLGNMLKTLINILLVSFIIEGIGAYAIWSTIHGSMNMSLGDEVFTSVFHSVSAFCNAGISTLEGNLNSTLVNTNYNFILSISFLIVLGGIGFPILFNYIAFTNFFFVNWIRILLGKQKKYRHKARIINTHSKVVIGGTAVLIVVGTVLFFLFEQHHAHEGMGMKAQVVNSFFEAVTPRTAGFNVLAMGSFARPTLVLTFILMLIGAAPMSTGGGMKVSSVFIAILSVFDTARGKTQSEISGREINKSVTNKAFAVIILYLLWMFAAILVLSFTEPEAPLIKMFFEVASALSTVGLSLDFTAGLTLAGKYVIILTMFVGRIGVLAFFMGILKRYTPKSYRYPQADVIIG